MTYGYMPGPGQIDAQIPIPDGQHVAGNAIGILVLTLSYPLLPGNVANASSYHFPVLFKILDGTGIPQILGADPGLLDKVLEGRGTQSDLDTLRKLGNTVKTMSRCGLGQTAANPVLTTLQNFSGLYAAKIKPADFLPAFDLKQALQEAATITGRTAELEDIHL